MSDHEKRFDVRREIQGRQAPTTQDMFRAAGIQGLSLAHLDSAIASAEASFALLIAEARSAHVMPHQWSGDAAVRASADITRMVAMLHRYSGIAEFVSEMDLPKKGES